jgi:glycosyltransferase involved in cell wall biosynthesis
MKIGIFCPGYGRIPRGIETVVYEIFSRLYKNYNYEIDIYTGSKNFQTDFANIISVPVINYKTTAAALYSKIAKKFKLAANEPYDLDFGTFAVSSFLKILFKKKYDIIFNEAGLYMQYFLNIYRFFKKVPIIHSGHAGINKLEFTIANLKPDVYLASSPFAEQEIKKRWSNLDVRVLPNGVNLDDNSKINLNLTKPVILYVGALQSYKQVDKIIKAFKNINLGSLLIIGTGPEKNKLLKLINDYNIENVKMIDYVPLNELQKYFNSSDLFVMPSKNETFGIVYLNAMAANIPSIADKHPIQEWLLKDSGMVCDSENIEELSQTMIECLNIDWENRPAKRAKFFNWGKCSEAYKELIEEIVNQKEKYIWKKYWSL